MKVAVIGAGSWGTVVATITAAKTPTMLWARRPELAETINATNENPDYLPGVEIPERLEASADIESVVSGADVVVMAVPSHGYRTVTERLFGLIEPSTAVLSLTKGIERDTLMRMTQVTRDVMPEQDPSWIGVLSGPNLAQEIAEGQPAATVIAFPDGEVAKRLQALFMSPTLRVYTNEDVVGCEAAGALKNVMAIASGMAHGLGFGDNTMATLITRALAELTRLGTAMGGQPLTFAGLAGMGDLIATCTSDKSRNHQVGYGLGRGRSLDRIVREMNMVAEGVKSTKAVLALAARHGVEMPIAAQVGKVLYEGVSPTDAVGALMAREAKAELHGIS